MAERAEDLIGQYLADLFEPDEYSQKQAGVPAPNDTVAVPPKNTEVPVNKQDFVPVSPASAQLPSARAQQPLNATTVAPIPTVEVALAEPARQQLQQLLNTAWSAPAIVSAAPAIAPAVLASTTAMLPQYTDIALNIESSLDAPNADWPLSIPVVMASTGKPDWANKAFDTLIVDVAGLKLAIPLVVLGQIFQVTDGFSHLPGQGPLFLGTLSTPRGSLRVINTALLVMPERYESGFIDEVRFVVSLAGASAPQDPWQLALAVNRVAQPVSIACEDVVWRGERSKRPWLLGTVKSQMCALLDVGVIGQFLSGAH